MLKTNDVSWNLIPYQKENGKIPVVEFIDSFDNETKAKIMWSLKLLQENGKYLPQPYAKPLRKQIFELRISYRDGIIRILYFFDGNTIVLTNGLKKKDDKVPEQDKKTCIKCRNEYLQKKIRRQKNGDIRRVSQARA